MTAAGTECSPARRPARATLSPTLGLCAALLLAACGERAQTAAAGARKVDEQPWAGTPAGAPAYVASGWKAGDAASWESHMKARTQGQNEYSRAPTQR